MVWLFLVLCATQFDTTFQAGLIALNQNNLTVAESKLSEASRLEPRDARVWLALAQTYWKLHQPEPAQAAAAKVETLTTDTTVLRGLAVFYSETADYAKAADVLRAVVKRNPYEERSYFDLAQLQLKQQNFAAALETLDAGQKNFDKSPQLALAAGVAYYGLRRFPEAIDAFLRTIQLDPSIEQPYTFLGRMLDQAEDKLPAVTAAFAALVKRDPQSGMGHLLYGKALLLSDNFECALPLLRDAIELSPRSAEAHFALADLLERQRKFEEAAGEMRRSVELNPKDPVGHYRLARLYDRLGKTAEAQAERAEHARLSGGIK
jgi:tetratricopeptide (TPR) repeat protein